MKNTHMRKSKAHWFMLGAVLVYAALNTSCTDAKTRMQRNAQYVRIDGLCFMQTFAGGEGSDILVLLSPHFDDRCGPAAQKDCNP